MDVNVEDGMEEARVSVSVQAPQRDITPKSRRRVRGGKVGEG